MDKKYELTDETIEFCGKTLHRIKALKSFGIVVEGELGGYIENESNLSHEGKCWIYNDARVHDNAQVYDNARVYDEAIVCGDAKIRGCCIVSEGAVVNGNATIGGCYRICGISHVCGNSILE